MAGERSSEVSAASLPGAVAWLLPGLVLAAGAACLAVGSAADAGPCGTAAGIFFVVLAVATLALNLAAVLSGRFGRLLHTTAASVLLLAAVMASLLAVPIVWFASS